MLNHLARTSFIAVVVTLAGITNVSEGGLSAPPESHIRPMGDGQHMLVFLSPVPVAEDTGKIATIPDGRTVNLRETYPASGCYKLDSSTPLWTAPWEWIDAWFVTADCRYLVRVNYLGDGGFQNGGELSWGLKFYDRGQEIRSHSVKNLVDFPSLMEDTTSDWHYQWIGDFRDNPEVRSDVLELRTSTHEYYLFDIRTGEIIDESHLWRPLARGIAIALTVISISFLVWRSRRCHGRPCTELSEGIAGIQTGRARLFAPSSILSFSVRSSLILITIVALLCAVYRWAPHVCVLITSLILSISLTVAALRSRQFLRYGKADRPRKLQFAILLALSLFCWFSFYILTLPPTMALLDKLDTPSDVKSATILTVYRPAYWLFTYTSLERVKAMENYCEGWGIH